MGLLFRKSLCAVLLFHAFISHGEEDPDKDGFTRQQRFIKAAFELDVESVKKFLSEKIDVNARMGTLKNDSFLKNRWTLYNLNSNDDYMPAKWTALMAVAMSFREPPPDTETEVSEAAIEAARKRSDTVDARLIEARDERRYEIGLRLLNAGANMELTNGTAATPLNYAVLERYKKLALLLIDFGANVNGRLSIESDDEVRSTSPLHFAIHQPEIFKALIARGAPIDALDGNSQTPLFWAVESKSVEAVEIVLKAGADPTWKQPSAGWTLFKMLETNEEDSKEDIESKRKIAEMLRQAIAAREKETKQPH